MHTDIATDTQDTETDTGSYKYMYVATANFLLISDCFICGYIAKRVVTAIHVCFKFEKLKLCSQDSY